MKGPNNSRDTLADDQSNKYTAIDFDASPFNTTTLMCFPEMKKKTKGGVKLMSRVDVMLLG